MARQIEDIIVKLGLQGFEGLDKIRSSFRDLSKVTSMSERDINAARNSLFEFAKTAGNTEAVNKGLASALQGLRTQVDTSGRAYAKLTNDLNRLNEASRGSTDTLEKQRQALLNSASAGRQNTDSLQRQIDALKQLQRETRPGSSAFIQLGKDIDTVTVKLGKLKSEAQGFNLALNQQAGATPSVLNNQIAILQRGLQGVRYDAEKFVDTLRQIQLLQITQSGRTGRAGVIASYEAYQDPAYLRGFADPSRLPAMPDTTAALNQELSELSERLANTARGSSTYTDVAIRMAEVQRQLRTDVMGTSEAFRQLSIAEAGAERRAGKLADIQSYYATQGPLAPGVGGYRDPNTGAMIAAGAYTPGRIRVDEAAYARPIGPQPFPEAATQALRSVESAQKSVTDIYERAFIQRTELQAKYNQIYIDKALEGLDLEGELRKREFDTQLADFDKRMGIADKRRGRRLTGMQLAQGVGAALSGGIFGGPEGLIGGLGGLAVGGVGGAFAGAAFGAQLAGLRQAGAAAATYAAEVRRLQLALQGIVSTFDDYKAALAAVDSASRTYNVPVLEATQQFTKLSAAVLGSGGTIKDAENTFKGLTASVLATGGSVQDINGALVAAAQVFSKGKVTAEELRGQIGERLAGAFALFAESSNRSTKGLDAALNDGEVTIADFVKFTEFSLAKYGRTAQIIAASPEQAGARLDNALKALQKNVGDSLGPAGASFQDFATRAINGLDKVINKLVELKAIQPGAGYYVQQVLSGALTIPDLEQQVARAGARESALRQDASSAGLGFIANLLPDISAATKEARILEEALIKVRLIEKETNKDRKQRQTEEADALKEKLATSYLQAFEQREEAIAQARIQREEQIADIRKQALEQARQLERQFADERRALERDIANSKRGTADIEEDIARQRRLLAGEDPRIVEAEQRIVDVYREARDRDIDIKQQYADREFNRARTLSDFQKKTADDINKANETYAKSLGKIHREYARDVSKILDEASGKTAKRLAKAGQVLAAISELQALQMTRVRSGQTPVPADVDMPIQYRQQLDKINTLNKELLQSRRPAPSTADRFFAAYAGGGYENVAMTRGQAGVIIKKLEKEALQKNITPEAFVQALVEVGDFASSPDASRRTIRNLMATPGAGIAVRSPGLLRSMATSQLSQEQADIRANGVNPAALTKQIEPMLAIINQLQKDNLLRKNVTLSEVKEEIQKPLYGALMDWVKANLNSVRLQEIIKNTRFGQGALEVYEPKGLLPKAAGFDPESFGVKLTPSALKEQREYEKRLRYEATPAGRAQKVREQEDARKFREMRRKLERKLEQGAMLPGGDFSTDKLTRSLGNVATRQLQGVLTQVTDQLIAAVPYREGDTIGAKAQRTSAQPIRVIPATKGADKASEDARAAAAANSAAELQRQLLAISYEALAPLKEQNTRLQEQNDLFQAQQRYIKQGITPALAEEYAQIDQIGELNRRIAARQVATAIDKALTDGANNETVLQLVRNHRDLTASIDSNVNSAKNLASAYQDAQKAARFTQDERIGLGLREGAEQYVQSIGTMREATSQLAQTGIKGVEDAIFSLVTTGTANFREFAASILKDTARMIIQQLILRSVMQIIGAIGGGGAAANPLANFNAASAQYMPNALGNAFAANGIVPFAMGGIVDKPTMFKFADGGAGRLGLMGEAGPEAIMPLRRLPNGRLGVEQAAGGTSPVSVTVNVDANGTSVQGNAGQGEQLGRAISQAVQAELVRQQRPGGLLSR